MTEQARSQGSRVNHQLATEVKQVPVGYKQTEVGVIPEDWALHRLDEVCSVIDGDRGSNYPNGSDFIESGYCVFLSATNVTKSGFRFDDVVYITKEKDGLLRKGKLLKGDIVLTTRGSIGNFAFFDDSVPFTNLRINSGMVLVRCTTLALDAKYLFDVLRSSIVKRQLETMSFGSAQPQLTVRDINDFYVCFPVNREEQTAIANALSDVDALIRELEKLIAKKQAIKTATMQQLLTGRTRLPQFALREDGTPKRTKLSELGQIPEDWEVSDIRSISAVPMQNGLFYEPKRKGKGVPLVNVGDMYLAAPVDIESLELFDANANEVKAFSVSRGDIFFTRSSVVPNGIAFCNMFDSDRDDVVFDSHLIRVRPNTELVNPRYLYLNCLAKHARTALIAEAKTATMTTIDQGAINRCPVLVPPKEEQTAIATILSDMDAEIQALEQRLGKTRHIKQGMMQELLTGKTRLINGEWKMENGK